MAAVLSFTLLSLAGTSLGKQPHFPASTEEEKSGFTLKCLVCRSNTGHGGKLSPVTSLVVLYKERDKSSHP